MATDACVVFLEIVEVGIFELVLKDHETLKPRRLSANDIFHNMYTGNIIRKKRATKTYVFSAWNH